MADGDGDGDDALSVPERFDDESFRAGYAQAMRHIGQTALAGADGIDPAPVDECGPADDSDDVCPECGADTLASMGAPDDVTPAGRVCPACEL